MKCPKCGIEWIGDSYSTRVETPGKFIPKCGNCGFLFKET